MPLPERLVPRRLAVTAKMRSGSKERIDRSPGFPPTTSIDSVPLFVLRTWARNSQVAPRSDSPPTTTGSPACRPFQVADRTR